MSSTGRQFLSPHHRNWHRRRGVPWCAPSASVCRGVRQSSAGQCVAWCALLRVVCSLASPLQGSCRHEQCLCVHGHAAGGSDVVWPRRRWSFPHIPCIARALSAFPHRGCSPHDRLGDGDATTRLITNPLNGTMSNSAQDPAGRRPSTIQRQLVRDASGNVHHSEESDGAHDSRIDGT